MANPDSEMSRTGFSATQARTITIAVVVIAVAVLYIAAKAENLVNTGVFTGQMLDLIEENTNPQNSANE